MARFVGLCALVGTLTAACASAPAPRPDRTPPEVSARPEPAAPAPATPAPTEGARTVTRTAVLDVLDKGIPWILRQVETEPELAGGQFVGFRLVTFFQSDARFRGVDIAPGDVVLRINGLPIERPEQAYRIWQELRVASEIRVEILRAGTAREVDYTIVDG